MGDVVQDVIVRLICRTGHVAAGNAALDPCVGPQPDDLGLAGLHVVALAAVAGSENIRGAGMHAPIHHDSPVNGNLVRVQYPGACPGSYV